MNRLFFKLLLAATCAGLTWTAGWFIVLRPNAASCREEFVRDVITTVSDWFKDPNDEVGNGCEVCVRCGAYRKVKIERSGKYEFFATGNAEQTWAEARIGPCKEHAWRETGCWESRWGVSCCMRACEHLLWKSLQDLDPEHAEQMARRFDELPSDRQIELFDYFNSSGTPDKGLAQLVAEEAGWCDLADFWAD